MTKKIRIQRLRGGTLLKLLLIGNLLFFVPLLTIIGILGVFGLAPVTLNDKPVTGPMALIAALIGGGWLALFFSIIPWGTAFLGLWLYSRFKSIELRYVPASETEKTTPS